jgi:hypothetical protein
MVIIEDITEQEAKRPLLGQKKATEAAAQRAVQQAAAAATAAAEADARQSPVAAGSQQKREAQEGTVEGPSGVGEDGAASQQPPELTEADRVRAAGRRGKVVHCGCRVQPAHLKSVVTLGLACSKASILESRTWCSAGAPSLPLAAAPAPPPPPAGAAGAGRGTEEGGERAVCQRAVRGGIGGWKERVNCRWMREQLGAGLKASK